MKTRIALISVLALALGAAAPAVAQEAITPRLIQATFQGSAPGACRLDTPTASGALNAALQNATPSSADVAITRLVDDNGAVLGSSVTLSLPVVCNQAHTINLSSARGGLNSDGVAAPGGPFRSSVPYGLRLQWAGASQTFASDAGAASFPVGDAAQGLLEVIIEIPAGGAPLTAGAYSDELVLELSAAG